MANEVTEGPAAKIADTAALVASTRAGSNEARDELVRRYQREVIAVAAALAHDAAEAEDLAQETFVRAFRNLDLLAAPDKFGGWLHRIAVGVTIDWLRAFRPSLYRGWSDADDELVAAPQPSPYELTLRAEIAARVDAALAHLPPRYRVPLSLYHLDGLSHARIAAALGVPAATVRSLVARARGKLRPLLAELAPDARRTLDSVFEEQPVTPAARQRFLHVANGTCTTDIIAAAGIPGLRSIWADPLYEGPVPAGLDDAALVAVRRRHLSGAGVDASAAWAGSDLSQDPVNDLRAWRAAIAAHEAYDELVLWFEHDLFDQLNLIQLLAWLPERLPGAKPASLICIGAFPGRTSFRGLGELTSDELASLLETRQPIGAAHYALAARAWQAFRAPAPDAMDALRREDTSALPFLAPAVARLLQEYPWTSDGLSRTERRLLQLADGGLVLATGFRQMHDGEQVYYVTDASLAGLAGALARTTPPLLTLDTAAGGGGRTLRGRVELTEAGRAVLSGTLDRVTACGIDRWLGGVHLQNGGRIWRWDDVRQRIV